MKKLLFIFLMVSFAHFSANAQCNTTVGAFAGVPTGGSDLNTHLGCYAGQNSTIGVFFNTFVGARSGEQNNNGMMNTFLGYTSGQMNDIGAGNTFLGVESGQMNLGGNMNTFVGLRAGVTNDFGSENSYFGHEANGDPFLQHASAIGANAYVCQDNTIVLGTPNDYTVLGDCQPQVNPFTGNFNRLTVMGGDLMVEDGHFITNPTLAPGGTPGLVITDPTGTLLPLSFTGNMGDYLGGDGNWHSLPPGGSDDDWYQVGSTTSPSSINDDMWTNGVVYVDWGDPASLPPGTIPNMGPNVKMYINGAIQTSSSYISSDRRFKKGIAPISNSLDKIKKIKGFNYEYNQEAFKSRAFPEGKTMGFLAQNLKEVVPEVVKTANDGYMAVNYDGIVALLVEGVNEQQKMIEEQQAELLEMKAELQAQQRNNEETAQLKAELEELKAAVQSICNEGCGDLGRLNNSIDKTAPAYWQEVELKQNSPNPFNANTSIRYYLPAEVQSATLAVYDLQGKQLRTYAIDGTGEGSVQIAAEDLPSGMYLLQPYRRWSGFLVFENDFN